MVSSGLSVIKNGLFVPHSHTYMYTHNAAIAGGYRARESVGGEAGG